MLISVPNATQTVLVAHQTKVSFSLSCLESVLGFDTHTRPVSWNTSLSFAKFASVVFHDAASDGKYTTLTSPGLNDHPEALSLSWLNRELFTLLIRQFILALCTFKMQKKKILDKKNITAEISKGLLESQWRRNIKSDTVATAHGMYRHSQRSVCCC